MYPIDNIQLAEAFGADYQELQEAANEPVSLDDEYLYVVEQEIVAEKTKKEPKYARLARKYIEKVRKIYNTTPWQKTQFHAQLVIEDLEMLSTVPLNDLEVEFEERNGVYQDADLLADQEAFLNELTQEWQADTTEALHEAALIERRERVVRQWMNAMGIVYRVVPHNIRRNYGMWKRLSNKPPKAPIPNPIKIYFTDTKESRSEIEQASIEAQAAYTTTPDDEEEPWYVDGEVTSVPISQNNTMELNLHVGDIAILAHEMKPYIDVIKAYARILKLAGDKDWKRKTYKSPAVQAFIDHLNLIAIDYAPQDVLVIARSCIFIWPHLSKIEHISTVTAFDSEIMDQALDIQEPMGVMFTLEHGTGPVPNTRGRILDWAEIEAEINQWEQEAIDRANHTDMRRVIALIRSMGNVTVTDEYIKRCYSGWYLEGVMQAFHAAEGIAKLDEAGQEQWRRRISDVGNQNYHAWLKAHKDDYRGAWKVFWKTGRITALLQGNSGIRLQCNDGSIQEINWGLASWKMQHNEIDLNGDGRKRLKAMLTERNWGSPMLRLL